MKRANNFDLLRLLLAMMVLISHCASLSREPSLRWLRLAGGPGVFGGPGMVAVQGFFAISGCLVAASYTRSASIFEYGEKRARRILPAYWAALIFALVLGTVLSRLRAGAFLMSPGTWKFALSNVAFANFLHPGLPGLFNGNPAGTLVNGALWTIKVEVMFYVTVPFLIIVCRRFGSAGTLIPLAALSVVFNIAMRRMHHANLGNQLPGQFVFFAVGMLTWFHEEVFVRNRRWMWLLAAVTCVGFWLSHWFVLQAAAIPVLTMCLALLTPHIAGPTQFGDFSYGIYLVHYPVIQALISMGVFHAHPLPAVLFAALAAGILGVASWKLIEAPVLRRRAVERPAC